MNGRILRRSLSHVLIGSSVAALSAGCHIDSEIKRRSIDELYGDAVAAAAVRPAPVQPGFRPPLMEIMPEEFEFENESSGVSKGAKVSTIPFSNVNQPTRSKNAISKWNANDHGLSDAVEYSISDQDVEYRKFQGANELKAPSANRPSKRSDANVVANGGLSIKPTNHETLLAPVPQRIEETGDVETRQASGEATPIRMTDMFDQTEIYEVIQILSGHFQVPIIGDDTIGGVVTAAIENETLDEALDKILLPLGLIHAEHEGRYIVTLPDPTSPLFAFVAKRSTYSPANHNVATLISLLPSRYRNFIQTSPERNLAVIEAPQRILGEIITRLKELDTPIGQVELEAIVCVVSPDSGFRFGLDWNHVVGVNDAQSLRIGLSGLAMSGAASKQGVQDAFSDFAVTSAFMRLLAQEGYITIRAAPRVTARDGEKASISLNRETFFSLQPDGSNVFFRQDVQKVEAGISLDIVPRIHGNMVAVEIAKAEVSEDIRSSSNADVSANPFPIINRRVVSTKVNVRDGNTIVIGGLVQRQTVDRVNRIPGLSGLPGVGKLFQTVEKQEQDVEVAVFISPRIVPLQPDECAP